MNVWKGWVYNYMYMFILVYLLIYALNLHGKYMVMKDTRFDREWLHISAPTEGNWLYIVVWW